MLALSIRQPWAHLIASGIKDIENRSWPTGHRGKFIIHAAKRFDEAWYQHPVRFRNQLNDKYGLELDYFDVIHLPRGGIVGQAEIVDCVKESDSIWFDGRGYGFVIENAMEMSFCPCMGLPGFFDVMPPLDAAINRIRQRLFPLFNQYKGPTNTIPYGGDR